MVLCVHVRSNKTGHLLLWLLLARTFNRMSHVQRADGVIERVRASANPLSAFIILEECLRATGWRQGEHVGGEVV